MTTVLCGKTSAPTVDTPAGPRRSPSAFRPAWWLPGPHAQTIWAALYRVPPSVPLTPERLELSDGDFIDLGWTPEPGPGIVVVLHGLEGSAYSAYALATLAAVRRHGWQGVVMHFRGCSGMPNRLPRSYHSGETGDLGFLIEILHARYPHLPLCAVGYSLGGNVLLKYLGERGDLAGLAGAVAVSVPFDLDKAARRMERGFSRLYQWFLVGKLRAKTAHKFAAMPSPINLRRLGALRTFRAFDGTVTAPLHGFDSAEDYYARSSSRQFLRAITAPTLILHASDDPFMTPDAVPTPAELAPSIHLDLQAHGGHVGFVAGSVPGRPRYWLDERIPAFLKTVLPSR
ncbi:MAG: hydrolase [Gammaproteobacteria bacterium]